jgi:hypothetical protein
MMGLGQRPFGESVSLNAVQRESKPYTGCHLHLADNALLHENLLRRLGARLRHALAVFTSNQSEYELSNP